METQIPEELQDKLEIIEKETDFFSQEPQKPRRVSFIGWFVIAAGVVGSLLALKSKDYFFMLFFVAFAVQQIATYFHEKRLFSMYSGACEIINFYKQKETSKT